MIGQLINLTNLNISSNKLTILPSMIRQLINLKELNISSNRLTSLPEFLGGLPNLVSLIISNNPLPKEILQLGDSNKLIPYLRDLIDKGVINRSFKIMVVGHEKVGKSSTINTMKQNWHPDTKNAVRGRKTEKIEIIDVTYNEIDIKFWDFPGQMEYYASHQFFISTGNSTLIF